MLIVEEFCNDFFAFVTNLVTKTPILSKIKYIYHNNTYFLNTVRI